MEQKRKVKSLLPVSETGELGILSRFLIVLSCIFCFGTLLMLALSVSYVSAATPYSVYTGGVEEISETLYSLDFARKDSLSGVEARIYMKSNSVGKNNLYIVPYPIMVQGVHGSVGINKPSSYYLNFLGGDLLDIQSQNISMIGGYDLNIGANNPNATIFGGKSNAIEGSSASPSPRVIIGGNNNRVEGVNGVILGGENNIEEGKNSFILGGEFNAVAGQNVIVAGYEVTGGKNNIFAFSNGYGENFEPKSPNAFYINLQKGLGLKMQASGGVASSGAVSFGLVKGMECRVNDENSENKNLNRGLIGLSGNCLYGCSASGWQVLGCFEDKWLTGDDTLGKCRGKVYDNATTGNNKEADRYERCFSGYEKMYQNVQFETSLWTGVECPTSAPTNGKNPCIYKCASGYHYIEGSGCMKDCEIPWGGTTKHGELITGYSDKEVQCGESKNEYGCEGVKAILQCNDGIWDKIGGSGTANVYGNTGINYKYKSCETKENKCNTGVYQYTNTGILNWINVKSCTDHNVGLDRMSCENGATVYSGRCFYNHTLTGNGSTICKTGLDTRGCRCKPNKRSTICSTGSLVTKDHVKFKNTMFIQEASGDSINNWEPKSKTYVPYTGNDKTECTFECDKGYSLYEDKNGKWQCLLNCEYNGISYENGQAISGYATGLVKCPDLCTPKDLICHDGKWIGGTTGCITTDKICSGFNFTAKIENADCKACTKYKGSLTGACTKENTMYKCTCYHNSTGGFYVWNDTKTKCVPESRAADCTGSMPPDNGNVQWWKGGKPYFTQTWSGGAGKWLPELVWSGGANKWLPEKYNFHYGTGDCGFVCKSGSSYVKSGNIYICEGNECVNHDFGTGFYFYKNSNNNLIGHTNSVLYEKLSEAQDAYGKGEKCIYYCDVCYKKVDKKCKPKTFTGTFWCKGTSDWYKIGDTQTYTYNNGDKVSLSCPNRSGYNFIGWATGADSKKTLFKKGDKLTKDKFNSCNNTKFYAVYECAEGYTGDGINCKLQGKCVGPEPQNAIPVPGTDTKPMSYDVRREVYEGSVYDYANRNRYCAYVCDRDRDYYYVLSGGEAMCLQCEDGTYDSDSKTCSVIIACSGSRVWDPETKTCQPLAMCTINGVPKEFNYSWSEVDLGAINGEDIKGEDNYKKERPIGKAKEFSCTNSDSDLRKHNCRFKCENGYSCVDGKCINNCPITQWEDYDYFYSNKYNYMFRNSRPINFIDKIVIGGGSSYGRQYTGRTQYDIYINGNANNGTPICLYTCKTGAHYGSWKYEGETVYGCVSDYFCQDKDLGSAVTKSNPTTWNKAWEYKTKEEFASLSATATGCFFTCTGGTIPYYGKCVSGDEYNCSSTFPAYLDELYVEKKSNPTERNQSWQYVDDLSSVTTGCKYSCKDGFFTGVYYKTSYGYTFDYTFCGCMPKSYITGYNSSNYDPYIVGGGGRVWTYNEGNPTAPGCYYKCKNGAILASDGSCKQRENFCEEPSRNTYFNFNLGKTWYSSSYFYQTFYNYEYGDQDHTEWIYVDSRKDLDNKENSQAVGCFFTCVTGTLKKNVLPNDDNYYCWNECGSGKIFTKAGCKPCENNSLTPDFGNTIEGNAISCTDKCTPPDVYVGNGVCQGPEGLSCTDDYDYYIENSDGSIRCMKCAPGTHWNETEKKCE